MIKYTFGFLIIVMAFSGCQSIDKKPIFIDQELNIKVPESELYARVRGNPEKPLLLNLHGGPGGYSGIDIHFMGPGLEEDFLVVYLDQRGCGKSAPCNDTNMLTVEQYLVDLNIVIDSILVRYGKTKVNLIGTSWGGMYGFLYLLEAENQEKVKAYACIDGKVNSQYQNQSLIEYELFLVDSFLQTKTSEGRREELQAIKSALEAIQESDFRRFHRDVNRLKHEFPAKLGFNAYFVDTSKIIAVSDVLKDSSLLALMRYTPHEYIEVGEKAEIVNAAFRNTSSYNQINIEPDLNTIEIPTLVIQGDYDYVVGRQHARMIYDALTGLSVKEKELHILPNVGHCPAIEAPDTLNSILSEFFIKHN